MRYVRHFQFFIPRAHCMVFIKLKCFPDPIYITPVGAILVAPDYVLTAAHCAVIADDAKSLAVLIGAVCPNSGDNCGQPSQLINVQTVTNHPGYNSGTTNNDFSLLKLVSSASATPVAM